MSLLSQIVDLSKRARVLLLVATTALGGCGAGNAFTDCAARCKHEPQVRDYHGCYKACHMSFSANR